MATSGTSILTASETAEPRFLEASSPSRQAPQLGLDSPLDKTLRLRFGELESIAFLLE